MVDDQGRSLNTEKLPYIFVALVHQGLGKVSLGIHQSRLPLSFALVNLSPFVYNDNAYSRVVVKRSSILCRSDVVALHSLCSGSGFRNGGDVSDYVRPTYLGLLSTTDRK